MKKRAPIKICFQIQLVPLRSGNFIVVGAPKHGATGGAAYVYKKYNGTDWNLHKKISASAGVGLYKLLNPVYP